MSAAIPAAARPRLARGVRLREDPRRGWILLAPETVFAAKGSAADILALCDGTRTFGDLVATLSTRFCVAPERVAADAEALLARLRDQRLVDL
ncbi:pyrroloquinoline quinone biosynthesis protein D [Aquabacter spiritensis]|uniref:Pyrroloquinoline quinone biosynthesis protein D n=1 Tax=Aquabacter spiritensis TaxID=933073 RepID=A0A4R3LZQ0_9HYPH|nr:pyrroloquinoline quinone biosynthesis peptide chaperone PqqD [Aquabacter spiritensis]TCT04275.1 pyrroloquinoline quinone biosynthesis protein D [Aquabacter spiritensis]